jgi:hypothetical protein
MGSPWDEADSMKKALFRLELTKRELVTPDRLTRLNLLPSSCACGVVPHLSAIIRTPDGEAKLLK